jgi:hypothetical protein
MIGYCILSRPHLTLMIKNSPFIVSKLDLPLQEYAHKIANIPISFLDCSTVQVLE